MLQLPNGCRCSVPKLSKTTRGWKVWYRFYDPTFPRPKFVEIKAGLNLIPDKNERRQVATLLIDEELHKLQKRGFNPFTGTYTDPGEIAYEIDPATPFPDALKKAVARLDVEHHTRRDMNSITRAITTAATQLRLSNMAVGTITRRHLKLILEQCGRNSRQWSPGRYNTYRGYLMMMYKELVELEAVPGNPVRDIAKKATVQKIKTVLTDGQRQRINGELPAIDIRFFHFVHLFFHSGGRKTELLQLKPVDVDLTRQVYRCTIKKGKNRRQVERTIKDVALPYWSFFLRGCPPEKFIFGPKFYPGEKPMGVDMPSRYWQRYVKTGMGIDVDLYSLKHLHTTQIVDLLDEHAAAEMNKHTGTDMVAKVYDIRRAARQHERLKKAGNEF